MKITLVSFLTLTVGMGRLLAAMNASTDYSSTKPPRFNFSATQKRLDAIIQRANDRLEQLVSEDRVRSFCEFSIDHRPGENKPGNSGISEPQSNGRVSFQLRLGRTRLSLHDLSSLEPDAIIPLLDSTKGQVQIWSNGRLFGRGVLLVADEKLAVKIESIE